MNNSKSQEKVKIFIYIRQGRCYELERKKME